MARKQSKVAIQAAIDVLAEAGFTGHIVNGAEGYFLGELTSSGGKAEVPTTSSPLETQVGGDHYKHFAVQPVQFLEANKGMLSFTQEAMIKYICRLGKKGSLEDTKKDIAKVRHFMSLYEELNGIN